MGVWPSSRTGLVALLLERNGMITGIHFAEVTVKKSQRGVIIMHLLPAANTFSVGIPGSRTAGWSMLPRAGLLVGNASHRRVYFRTVRFTAGDVIGVYLDIDADYNNTGHLFFICNGHRLAGVKGCSIIREQKPYYVSISLEHQGDEVTFNFSVPIPSLS